MSEFFQTLNWVATELRPSGGMLAPTRRELLERASYTSPTVEHFVLAVPACTKWYSLYVIHTVPVKGMKLHHEVAELHYHHIEAEIWHPGLPYAVQGDHCVHPSAVQELCGRHGIIIPNLVDRAIKGLWWENEQ